MQRPLGPTLRANNLPEVVDQLDAYYLVAYELMSTQLINILCMQSIITHAEGSDALRSISAINSKYQDSITPEELSICLCIVINTSDPQSYHPSVYSH